MGTILLFYVLVLIKKLVLLPFIWTLLVIKAVFVTLLLPLWISGSIDLDDMWEPVISYWSCGWSDVENVSFLSGERPFPATQVALIVTYLGIRTTFGVMVGGWFGINALGECIIDEFEEGLGAIIGHILMFIGWLGMTIEGVVINYFECSPSSDDWRSTVCDFWEHNSLYFGMLFLPITMGILLGAVMGESAAKKEIGFCRWYIVDVLIAIKSALLSAISEYGIGEALTRY